jgi:hypothetical protein
MVMFHREQVRDDVMIQLRSGKERPSYFWKDGKGACVHGSWPPGSPALREVRRSPR